MATGTLPAEAVAEEAVRLAPEQPARARALAADVLVRAAGVDPDAEAVAERAMGLAARAANDLPQAEAHLRRSLDVALAAGLEVRAAQARTSLSLVLALRGRTVEALREADLATGVLAGADAGRLEAQRALILQRLGRFDEALEGNRRALVALRRAGDVEAEARVLTNRGVIHAYRGEFRAAERDSWQAARLHDRLGHALQAAEARENLGFVAARRGDIPAALAWYERADRELRPLGAPRAVGLVDRCETFLAARLLPEAREAGEAAAAELAAGGRQVDVADVRVLLAEVALLQGDLPRAAHLASLAREAFLDQHRPGWAALAAWTLLQVAVAVPGPPTAAVLAEARRTVEELEAARWAVLALDARLVVARLCLALGRGEEAEAELRKASPARRRGPARIRARAWHAEALLRDAKGDRRGADAAARAGLRVLTRHVASVGATELRVHAAGEGLDLVRFGLSRALDSGRPEQVLRWSERARAWVARLRPVRPPVDSALADDLAELRHLAARIEEHGFRAETAEPLLRRQAALEEQIRRKMWRAVGAPGDDASLRAPSVGELAAALGEAALVEMVECDGVLHAVTVAGRRSRLRRLGPLGLVRSELAGLRFALGRTAGRAGAAASQAALRTALEHAARRLDDLLLGPLAGDIGDRPLLVIPTAGLHALPWAALPSCRARPVTVSPSAALWLRARSRPAPTGAGAVLVAGPSLRHAAAEVRDVAACHPGATTFEGRRATTTRVVRSLDGATLAHLAAHGSFRADNPLFSSLRLADGPLTVYDLESLSAPPHRLVLSACEAGLSASKAGDELLGVTSALLAVGAQTVVASVATVPDAVTRPLMVEFHRRLAAGAPPASALADARAATSDGTNTIGTAGFVCFGSG